MSDIDLDAVVQSVRDIAAEQPDFQYTQIEGGCFYERDGKPSCIIGQALYRQGIPVEDLREMDNTVTSGIAHILARDFGINIKTNPLGMWLHEVQRRQDLNIAWGEAVARADQEVSL